MNTNERIFEHRNMTLSLFIQNNEVWARTASYSVNELIHQKVSREFVRFMRQPRKFNANVVTSVLMELPLPRVILHEQKDGTLVCSEDSPILDLIHYVSGGRIEVLTDANVLFDDPEVDINAEFDGLPNWAKRRLEDALVEMFIIEYRHTEAQAAQISMRLRNMTR